MPIYEYRCRKCGKRFSILTLRVGESVRPRCKHCGNGSAQRIMSRFAMPRSEETRLDALADPSSFSDLDDNDPKSVARWMRRMGKEMGDELGESDLDKMIDEMERGTAGNAGEEEDDF